MNGYELSRDWFDFSFDNPELIKPTHTAMYFFIIEHCNRLGWKSKFGLPMEMTKDAIGIKNYRTYQNTFNDLVDWGFIKVVQKSKNQYSSNIIAIVKNTKAHTKALSKAMQKHSQKQCKSIVGIDKPYNHITKEQYNCIIDYLNLKCKTSYKASSIKTKELINARLNEGFNVDDFKKVIDIKANDWLTDEKMCVYLRPETLFSNKFEGYLNQKQIDTKKMMI